MGLIETQITVKFAGGIETKMDSKAVPSVRLLNLENGVFTRAISIRKRNGYESLAQVLDGSDSLITGVKKMAKRDDEHLEFTRNRCYSRQDSASQWLDAGAVIAATATDRGTVATSSQQTMPDHATLGDITAYAWEDSRGGVWWTVENTNGAVYRTPVQADALGQRPRCVPVADGIHIYYAVPTTSSIMCIVVNPAHPSAAVAPVLLISDLSSTNPTYDAVPTARAGKPACIAWKEAGTGNFRIGYVTAGGQLGSPINGNPSVITQGSAPDAVTPIAVAFKYVDGADGDRIVTAHYSVAAAGDIRIYSGGISGTTAIGATFSATALTGASNTTIRIALTIASNTIWTAFERQLGIVSPTQAITDITSITLAGVAGSTRQQRSLGLASRAFQAGDAGDTFAVFVHAATYFNTYMTLRLSDSAPAGRHLAAQAFGLPTRGHLSSAHVSNDIVTVTLPYVVRLASANNDKFTEAALRQIRMNFSDPNAYQTAQLGRGLYMAAACPQHYDGRQWTEQGFNVGPENIIPTPSAGGALTVSSTYLYYVWYEWTDNQGEIHRGPTSQGTTVITGAADTQVSFVLPMLRITRKNNVRICVGRSLPGDASQVFRVSSLDPTVSGPNGFIANDPTVDNITFIDQMSDANLRLQERVYTTGGILSNDPTSLGSFIVSGKNRLFFTDMSAGSVIRYSQRIATGYGVEIAPELALDIDPYGGDVTALAIMDDVVFAFKHSCIYAFNGDGPIETGSSASQGFSSSQLITSDVGCDSPSSIVLTPKGLMFKSAKGIYMIARSREVTYVGAPVEAYNAQDVTRALVMPDRTQVLFLTSAGKSLLYDYLFDQWSTFTNHEGLDAVIVDNTYCYLRTNDLVYRETPGICSDAGSHIPLRLETAWLHLGESLQGFMRFWRALILGTWVSPHQLGVSYRTDYTQHWSEIWWLDATGGTDATGWLTGDSANAIGEDPLVGSAYGDGPYGEGPYGGTPDDVYQWKYGIHEEGQSIQLRFEDYEKYGLAGASFELTEMTIVGGAMKVDNRPFPGSRST